jgi:ribosomal protein L11 methylase PrmA
MALPICVDFKPIALGEFVVLPPWLKPIFINPGSAFGTGLHPTTQLCLKAIEDFLWRVGLPLMWAVGRAYFL